MSGTASHARPGAAPAALLPPGVAARSLFLSALDADQARALRALAVPRSYAAGTVVLHQGDDSAALLVLTEGRVKVSAATADGREVILGFAGAGQLIGELAAFDHAPRSATVTALQRVDALAIPGEAFRRFVEARPPLAVVLLQEVSARLRAADRQRLELAAHDVLGRLARRLLALAEELGAPGPDGIELALGLTQEDLAALTGSSREATSRALTSMRRLGWVATRRRAIVVRDVEALRGFVRGG